jgi:hypothetical protein
MMARRSPLGTLRAHLEACGRRRIERQVADLLPLLGSIRDPEIRLRRFAEDLRARPVEEAAWALASLVDRLAGRDERARPLGEGLLDRAQLARVLGEAWVQRMAAVLTRRGHPAAALFVAEAPAEGEGLRPSEPLGYRVSLARQPARRLVERLLFDPDPRVIQVLLGNPRLTEADVVKLAASRAATPAALDVIALDARWIARYSVKLALAGNPRAPARLALRLLPGLLQSDLRDIALTALRTEVRERAAALFARRQQA